MIHLCFALNILTRLIHSQKTNSMPRPYVSPTTTLQYHLRYHPLRTSVLNSQHKLCAQASTRIVLMAVPTSRHRHILDYMKVSQADICEDLYLAQLDLAQASPVVSAQASALVAAPYVEDQSCRGCCKSCKCCISAAKLLSAASR